MSNILYFIVDLVIATYFTILMGIIKFMLDNAVRP